MIRIVSLKSDEGFLFTVTCLGHPSFVTSDPERAAEALFALGIHDPDRVVQQAQQWGTIEIPSGARRLAATGNALDPATLPLEIINDNLSKDLSAAHLMEISDGDTLDADGGMSTERPKRDRMAWVALLVMSLVAVSAFFFVI